MRRALLFVAFVLYAATAAAQTPTVPRNQSFTVQMDHDALLPTSYEMVLDGVVTAYPLSVRTGTVINIPVPAGVPAGTHTVFIAAIYPAPIGKLSSAVLTFVSVAPASPPTNPRILVNGTVVQNGATVPAQFALALNVNKRTKAVTLTQVAVEVGQ